jgi:excisionase family DNA binding protein
MTSAPRLRDRGAFTRSGFRDRRYPHGHIHFFTIAEVAESLSVSTRTVRIWINAGDLVVHRVNTIVRIAEPDLRAFLALHREG